MERRSCDRVPAKLKAILFYGNIVFSGVVTDISENGMFIRTELAFPVESIMKVSLLVTGSVINTLVKVKRCDSSDTQFNGIGVTNAGAKEFRTIVNMLK